MTAKAYTRSVRGHMMLVSAVLLLLLEEFWDSLTTDEQALLVKIYDSSKPEEYKNDPIAVYLMQWFTTKKGVSSKCRTTALWLNYVHYRSCAAVYHSRKNKQLSASYLNN